MPFVPGFPLPVLAPFGLCGHPLSLAAISVALSPHSKIPFLAAEAQRLTSGLLSHGGQASAAPATAVSLGRALLLRIQPERFELPIPFRRSIAQPLDVDASRQTALDSGANQPRSKEGERDGHVDMTDAALLAQCNLLNVSDGT